VLLLHPTASLLQEQKPTAPPSRLPAPADTARVGEKPRPEPGTVERSRLELPDVLIIGKDRSKRLAGEKVYSRAVPVELRERTVEYEPVRFQIGERREKALSRQAAALRLGGVEALATYGDYRWVRAEAVHWGQRARWSYQVAGEVDRTEGQYEYSARARYGFRGRLGISAGEKGRVGLSVGVNRTALEMNVENVRRAGTAVTANADYTTDRGNATLRLSGGVRALWLAQEPRESAFAGLTFPTVWEGTASRTSLEAALEWQIGRVTLLTALQFVGDRFRLSERDTAKARNDLSTLLVELNLPVAQRASVAAGVALQTLKSGDEERVSKVFANARMAATLTPFLGVFAEARSGYQLVDPTEIWYRNPYFWSLGMDWTAERIEPAFAAGGELKLLSGTRLRLRWGRSHIRNAHYWGRTFAKCPLLAVLLAYPTLPKLERNELSLGLDFSPAAGTDVSVELVQVSEELESDPERLLYPGFTRRPFLAHWRLPMRASWRPISSLRLGLAGAWVGKRPTVLEGELPLPAYTMLDAEAEVSVSRYVMIRMEVRNLTNADVVLWPGHPEFGRLFAIGLHGAW